MCIHTNANQYCIDYDLNPTLPPTELNRFMEDIGFKESTNNYSCVNPWGYLGKYQFSNGTLIGLGYNIPKNEFLNNPQIQDQAMVDLLKENHRIMKTYIKEYNNVYINDIKITKSGILAATHLVGPRAVKKYLSSNGTLVTQDNLGTSIEDYMSLFSDYKLEL